MIKIGQNAFYTGYYDPETKIAYHKYDGQLTDELVVQSHDMMIAFNTSPGMVIHGNCADLSQVRGTWTKHNDRVANEVFPSYIQAGLKAQANVQPEDVFGSFSNDQMQEQVIEDFNLSIREFDDYAEAQQWVCEKLGVAFDASKGNQFGDFDSFDSL